MVSSSIGQFQHAHLVRNGDVEGGQAKLPIDKELLLSVRKAINELLNPEEAHNPEQRPEAIDSEFSDSLRRILCTVQNMLDPADAERVDSATTQEDIQMLKSFLKLKKVQETTDAKQVKEFLLQHLNQRAATNSRPQHLITRLLEGTIKKLTQYIKVPSEHIIENPDQRISYAFRDRQIIPCAAQQDPVYAYPHAEQYILPAHRDRFPGVVNIFKRAVEGNTKLSRSRDWVEKISYNLMMCGTDMLSAKASIVVFCPSGNDLMLSHFRQTLNQKHVLDQYAHGHTKVAYELHVWGEAFKYTGGTMEAVDIYFDKNSSLCGSPVTDISGSIRLSTIACILEIKSEYFALTSAHPLGSNGESTSNTESTIDDSSGLSVIVANAPLSPPEPNTDVNSKLLLPNFDYTHRISHCPVVRPPRDSNWIRTQPNLDWSLVKLRNVESLESNSFQVSVPQQARRTRHISHLPTARPSEQRHVCIILSEDAESKGVISSVPTYISNSSGYNGLCEVWTVLLTHGRKLEIGDSGSLVVDQETNEAYGHVIAVDPMGRLFVIPLIHTLNQIRDVFQTKDVELFSRDRAVQTEGWQLGWWVGMVDSIRWHRFDTPDRVTADRATTDHVASGQVYHGPRHGECTVIVRGKCIEQTVGGPQKPDAQSTQAGHDHKIGH